MSDPALPRFHAWFAALSPERRRALGRAYAEAALAGGAYVARAEQGAVPIPPILTPVPIQAERLAALAADSRALAGALARLTTRLMEDPGTSALRDRLFGIFGPLEQEALEQTWRAAASLATVRVDYLLLPDGQPRALEVNATIPAMQGYSDAIAEAFLRAVAAERGLPLDRVERLLERNGSNVDDLRRSLEGHHRRLGGTGRGLRIAIVARRGDAQRGELDRYARAFSAAGHQALVLAPEELARGNEGPVARGAPVDLIYRHIFLRRLDPASELARLCLEPERYRVLNPAASHLEVKAMLGLLSEAAAPGGRAEADRIGLSDIERGAIARVLPWTRLLRAGPSSGPAGETLDDLVAFTRGEAPRLVLKRSWDYGGKGVFLGPELDPARLASLVEGSDRPAPTDWSSLLDFALSDRDAWVVQELVDARPLPLWRIEEEGPVERELYADLSIFTNLGAEPVPAGGAVRAAQSRIVNILGGGGMAPLVREDVLADLLA